MKEGVNVRENGRHVFMVGGAEDPVTWPYYGDASFTLVAPNSRSDTELRAFHRPVLHTNNSLSTMELFDIDATRVYSENAEDHTSRARQTHNLVRINLYNAHAGIEWTFVLRI